MRDSKGLGRGEEGGGKDRRGAWHAIVCDLYAHICHTQRHATTLHGGEAQTQGHTGTHTQEPASGDNGGWKDTTGGDADERRRRRRDDQVLEQLSATDTLKDNPRAVSPHMCGKCTKPH